MKFIIDDLGLKNEEETILKEVEMEALSEVEGGMKDNIESTTSVQVVHNQIPKDLKSYLFKEIEGL
jgi:hypothetical protein